MLVLSRQTILKEIGQLPVVENGDTSILLDTCLFSVLDKYGYKVSKDNTDQQWDLYWDIVYEIEGA